MAALTAAADPAELDRLYAAWRRVGVGFTVTASHDTVEVERLILATAANAGADERLMVCGASWLAVYHTFVDGRRLSELARRRVVPPMHRLLLDANDPARATA